MRAACDLPYAGCSEIHVQVVWFPSVFVDQLFVCYVVLHTMAGLQQCWSLAQPRSAPDDPPAEGIDNTMDGVAAASTRHRPHPAWRCEPHPVRRCEPHPALGPRG